MTTHYGAVRHSTGEENILVFTESAISMTPDDKSIQSIADGYSNPNGAVTIFVACAGTPCDFSKVDPVPATTPVIEYYDFLSEDKNFLY